MAQIVPLEAAKQSAPPNTIEMLEKLLDMAKRGEILSLAYVTVNPGGYVGTGYETSRSLNHAHQMVAGTVYLQRRLEANAEEDL